MGKSKKGVKVTTSPRLHLGLLDCGTASDRLFGGVGLMIDGLHTVVAAYPAADWSISYGVGARSSVRTMTDVRGLIGRLSEQCEPMKIQVIKTPFEHMGFGSKTSLLLSITHATSTAAGNTLSREEMIRITNRGGTSGAGVNLFWQGGLIIDAGHSVDAADREFKPSSESSYRDIPPINARIDFPDGWRVSLFYDPLGKNIEGKKESEIFAESMPLPEIESLWAIAAAYHGILPSVKEQNMAMFTNAIKGINVSGMKRIEVMYQTEHTQNFLGKMWDVGVAAGLSSFGPLVFSVTDNTKDEEFVQSMAEKYHLECLGTYSPNNKGALVEAIWA